MIAPLRSSLALVALLLCSVAPAATGPDAIDKIVVSEMKRQFSPAVGIAVVRNGRVVKTKGYGYSNVEHMVKATEQTVFQTASIGKQFTATLVMLLVRDGKLSLDDLVSKHLSDAPTLPSTAAKRLTPPSSTSPRCLPKRRSVGNRLCRS